MNTIIISTAMFASVFLIVFGAVTSQDAYVTSGIGILAFCLGKIFNTTLAKIKNRFNRKKIEDYYRWKNDKIDR